MKELYFSIIPKSLEGSIIYNLIITLMLLMFCYKSIFLICSTLIKVSPYIADGMFSVFMLPLKFIFYILIFFPGVYLLKVIRDLRFKKIKKEYEYIECPECNYILSRFDVLGASDSLEWVFKKVDF